MTSEMIQVTKRDGRLENLDIEKIHRVVSWAAENLDVSPSEVELKAQIQLYNGIHTEAIHATLIKSAADLISLENPDYQYMAARLAVFNIRKIAYGEYTPPRLYTHIHSMIEKGIYDKEILEKYTEEEIDLIESFVDHNRDMNFAYAGIKQMESKYLVQNRVTKRVYESPQVAFILIPTCLFADYPKETRLDYIKKFYNALSLFKISLPTPIMAGVRTPTKQFSSCTVIGCDDSLDSINAATSSIVKYISQRAGIGIEGGRIRALGSEIRKGEAIHTGVIPFWKMFQAAVKSCSQGKLFCPAL
jgi:ribonucleoside-diphosphate reductase